MDEFVWLIKSIPAPAVPAVFHPAVEPGTAGPPTSEKEKTHNTEQWHLSTFCKEFKVYLQSEDYRVLPYVSTSDNSPKTQLCVQL